MEGDGVGVLLGKIVQLLSMGRNIAYLLLMGMELIGN